MRTFACCLLFLTVFNRRTHSLPAGFRDEGVAFKSGTTGFTFVQERDGKSILLICQRKGEVVALVDSDKPDGKLIDVLDIEERVCTQGERGVSQIAAHPNFAENRYIYLSYTYDKNGGCTFSEIDGPVNVVSRFRLNGDLKMVEEKIILQTTPLPTKVHNGLDMKFGHDGFLYVTLGNGGKANEYGNSQKANTLLGSIVRITDGGGIPPGNPFMDESDGKCGSDGSTFPSGRCSEIWSIGFRNPFRFAMNPNEKNFTQFYVNDVGGATWEEISEVTSKSPGKNYGYREMEGPCKRGSKTHCEQNERYEDPLYWYEHNEEGDGCVSGGAFVPKGIWPKEYDNKYMFGDFIFKQIFFLSEDKDGCRECSPPRPYFMRQPFKDTKDTGQPVQLTFGPYRKTQALYYSLWSPGEKYSIRRIVYEGGENTTPDAAIQIEDKAYDINEAIIFDGSRSSDPDGNDLSFEWNFGDGSTSAKDIDGKSYGNAGKYTVTLTVSDANGFQDKTSTTIIVGAPPKPVIVNPTRNETFAVDDVFTLYGYAVDADGESLPDSNLTWEVRQVHNTHYHPFLPETAGNEIVIPPAPSPEDFDASTNSFLRILLTATDSNGLTSTTTRDIMPKTKTLYFETDPPGLELILDGFNIRTPIDSPLKVISWVNHDLIVDVEDQGSHIFDKWSNGVRNRQSVNKVNATSDEYVNIAMFVQANSTLPRTENSTGTENSVEGFPVAVIEVAPGVVNAPSAGIGTGSALDTFLSWSSPRIVPGAPKGCKSIYETICGNIDLGGFCRAIGIAGLENTFSEGRWTVFIPDDGAIYKAPEAFLGLLQEDSSEGELLKEYILYHAVPDKELRKNDLPCSAGANLVKMANGRHSRTLCEDGTPTYQKGNSNSDFTLPRMVEFDIAACNGVIHIVDKVLLL